MSPCNALSRLGGRQSLLGSRFVGLMRAGATVAATSAALGAATLGAAHAESRFPIIRRADVPVAPRPGFRSMRILHISDLHMFAGQDFIIRFLHKVAAEEDFDFVVSTGDNLSDLSGIPLLMEALEPLTAWPGAFVLGSNDYYLPEPKAWASYLSPTHHTKAAVSAQVTSPNLPWVGVVNDLVAAGWTDLTNQSETAQVPVESGLQLASLIGVDDPHIKRDRVPAVPDSWDSPSALRIGLTHAPYKRTLDDYTHLGADLILAGHTHGGQLRLPGFGALVNNTDIPIRYSRGLYRWLADNQSSWVNISAGLGTSRYAQVRLFCRPEVSILNLVPAN